MKEKDSSMGSSSTTTAHESGSDRSSDLVATSKTDNALDNVWPRIFDLYLPVLTEPDF